MENTIIVPKLPRILFRTFLFPNTVTSQKFPPSPHSWTSRKHLWALGITSTYTSLSAPKMTGRATGSSFCRLMAVKWTRRARKSHLSKLRNGRRPLKSQERMWFMDSLWGWTTNAQADPRAIRPMSARAGGPLLITVPLMWVSGHRFVKESQEGTDVGRRKRPTSVENRLIFAKIFVHVHATSEQNLY